MVKSLKFFTGGQAMQTRRPDILDSPTGTISSQSQVESCSSPPDCTQAWPQPGIAEEAVRWGRQLSSYTCDSDMQNRVCFRFTSSSFPGQLYKWAIFAAFKQLSLVKGMLLHRIYWKIKFQIVTWTFSWIPEILTVLLHFLQLTGVSKEPLPQLQHRATEMASL